MFLCSTCKYALDWYVWPLCHVLVLCHCLAHERHISETPVKFKVILKQIEQLFGRLRKKINLRCMYERFYAVENRGKFRDMKHTVKTKDKNGNFWRQYKRLYIHVWQEIRCSLLKKDVGTLQHGVLTPEIIGSVPKRSWQSSCPMLTFLLNKYYPKMLWFHWVCQCNWSFLAFPLANRWPFWRYLLARHQSQTQRI